MSAEGAPRSRGPVWLWSRSAMSGPPAQAVSSLARAQALGTSSIQSARSSVAAASSRSVTILVACLLAALTIGIGVALWLVRSIARPVARLVAIVGGDMPS